MHSSFIPPGISKIRPSHRSRPAGTDGVPNCSKSVTSFVAHSEHWPRARRKLGLCYQGGMRPLAFLTPSAYRSAEKRALWIVLLGAPE